MDPSIPAVQDTQNQQPANQPVNQVQSPVTAAPPVQQQKTQVSVGNVEAGAATMIQENSDADADDEDEIKIAPQEITNQTANKSAGVDTQEEDVKLQPTIPEIVVSSPEVETIIEASVDQDKPELSKEVKAAGVTHSGPGVIVVKQSSSGVQKMPPITYEQAKVEEKKTQLHEARHWYLALVLYLWQKINPKAGEKDMQDGQKDAILTDQAPTLSVEEHNSIEQSEEGQNEAPSSG